MQSFTIPIARSIKGLLMMLCDSIMIVVALGFSFALLGKNYPEQDQIFYFAIAVALSVFVLARIDLYRAIILYMGCLLYTSPSTRDS